jgi:hypothetical protein
LYLHDYLFGACHIPMHFEIGQQEKEGMFQTVAMAMLSLFGLNHKTQSSGHTSFCTLPFVHLLNK